MERGDVVLELELLPRCEESNRVCPARMDNSSSSPCLIFPSPLMGDVLVCANASAWWAFSFSFVRTACKHFRTLSGRILRSKLTNAFAARMLQTDAFENRIQACSSSAIADCARGECGLRVTTVPTMT
jgi:hypothetical protein